VWALLGLCAACLPGKRSNEPLATGKAPTDAVAADSDGGGPEAEVKGDAPGEVKADVDAGADSGEVAGADVADAALADDGADASDSGAAVGVPGCTTDTQCAALPFGPCAVGQCDLTTGVCFAGPRPDGSPCQGDQCATEATCLGGSCAGAAKNCNDKNDCTVDACDPGLGCYSVKQDGVGCDDKQACTTKDFCVKGVCVGTKVTCEDGNLCNDDECNPVSGQCVHPSWAKGTKQVPCTPADAAACKGEGVCDQGSCIGKFLCDDGSPCSWDLCIAGKCQNFPTLGPCGDSSNPCVTASCQPPASGVGLPTCVTKAKCDPKICTTVTCDSATGACGFVKLESGECDDDEPCTIDTTCIKGGCKGKLVQCDDGNPCTTEVCLSGVGCKATAVESPTPCDDGSGCTSGDACAAGKCAGKPIGCDDGNACTADTCDGQQGCAHAPATDGASCPTGTCKGGACVQ